MLLKLCLKLMFFFVVVVFRIYLIFIYKKNKLVYILDEQFNQLLLCVCVIGLFNFSFFKDVCLCVNLCSWKKLQPVNRKRKIIKYFAFKFH